MGELKKHPEGVRLQPPPMVYQKYEKGMMRRDRQPGFETPSGKVEIATQRAARRLTREWKTLDL